MTSSSREAFEAWKQEQSHALDRLGTYIGDPAEIWQAAIQHARDVAVKACEEYPQRDPAEDGSGYWAANNCADAIKEALK